MYILPSYTWAYRPSKVGCGNPQMSNKKSPLPFSSMDYQTKKDLFDPFRLISSHRSQEFIPPLLGKLSQASGSEMQLCCSGNFILDELHKPPLFPFFLHTFSPSWVFQDLLRKTPPDSCCLLPIARLRPKDPKRLLPGSQEHATLTVLRDAWNPINLSQETRPGTR